MVDVERWDEGRDGPVSETVLRARLERRGYAVSRYILRSPALPFQNTHTV